MTVFWIEGSIEHDICRSANLRRAGWPWQLRSAALSSTLFEFSVTETDGRRLSFTSSGKAVRMILTDDDVIAILTQSKVGKMTGVLTGEKSLTGSSSDYGQFAREHRELDQRLKQIFSHAGVDFPPAPDDSAVKQKVVLRIRSIYSKASVELDALIQDLDSSNYESRESATKTTKNRLFR